jgi:hypothetical protein
VTTWLKEAKNDDRRENGLQAGWKDRTSYWWDKGDLVLPPRNRFVVEGAYASFSGRREKELASSLKFLSTDASRIIATTKAAKVPRLLVVGGAGSLEVSPGLTLVNTPNLSSWLLLTVKAAYPPKTLRSHSWTSWNSRSTLANDSRSGTDGKTVHELSGGARSQSPTSPCD